MPNLYETRLFYNTGFTGMNIPDSPAVLNAAVSRVFESVFLRQDAVLSEVKLNATYADVSNADYCVIGSSYYFITEVEMLSDATARLVLAMDYVTTCGGPANVVFTDGWVKRAHAASDGMFENIIPEGFTPTRELVIDGDIVWDPHFGAEGPDLNLFSTTVKISELSGVAKDYASQAGLTVTVPRLPPAFQDDEGTDVTMFLPDATSWSEAVYKLPNARLWAMEGSDVASYVSDAWALGIPDIITSSYILPAGFYGERQGNETTGFDFIQGKYSVKSDTIPAKYTVNGYTPVNNKVYDVYNKYYLMSMCTRSSVEFDAHAIANPESPDGNVSFVMYSDPTPDGKPFYAPEYYQGKRNTAFRNSVAGATWQRSPIVYNNRAGWDVDISEFSRQSSIDLGRQAWGVGTGLAQNLLEGNVGGAINNVAEGYFTMAQQQENLRQLAADLAITAPTITFPMAPGIQNYVGNPAVIYRVRLSDGDVKRVDRLFTMYGYAQDKPLEKTDFTNRQYFNFVQCERVSVTTGKGRRFDTGVAAQLMSGVRVWHTLPNESYYTNNPIKEA